MGTDEFLSHYGVKGMKWGETDSPTGKGISTANSDGTGGGDDGTPDGRSNDPATWLDMTHTSRNSATGRVTTYTTKGFISQFVNAMSDKKIKMNGKTYVKPGIISQLLYKVGLKKRIKNTK